LLLLDGVILGWLFIMIGYTYDNLKEKKNRKEYIEFYNSRPVVDL